MCRDPSGDVEWPWPLDKCSSDGIARGKILPTSHQAEPALAPRSALAPGSALEREILHVLKASVNLNQLGGITAE